MLTEENFRGVHVIVTTPFDASLNLDEPGLVRTVEFCIASGSHGVVANANASEVVYLSDAERFKAAEIVVGSAKGRVATIVGCTTSCATLSVEFAKHAERIGADGIMAMPPNFHKATEREIRDYYRRLADATALPVVLQNFAGAGGTTMGARLMSDLLNEIPNVRFLKEETDYSSVLMTETMALAGDALRGTMGGKAGKALIDEFRRGACGTMPACEVADVHVALWNALEAGDTIEAKRIYRLLLPLISFEIGYGPAIYKEVLRRRGVIESGAFRQTGGRQLDEKAREELSDILADLAPLMRPDYRLTISAERVVALV